MWNACVEKVKLLLLLLRLGAVLCVFEQERLDGRVHQQGVEKNVFIVPHFDVVFVCLEER